jgi:hypothetical protein
MLLPFFGPRPQTANGQGDPPPRSCRAAEHVEKQARSREVEATSAVVRHIEPGLACGTRHRSRSRPHGTGPRSSAGLLSLSWPRAVRAHPLAPRPITATLRSISSTGTATAGFLRAPSGPAVLTPMPKYVMVEWLRGDGPASLPSPSLEARKLAYEPMSYDGTTGGADWRSTLMGLPRAREADKWRRYRASRARRPRSSR